MFRRLSPPDKTYCEECYENFDDDGFDYRFDFPVCCNCVREKRLTPTNTH